ncbi:hypothetical protein DFJ74DRAFT_94870 [Hyaloraphidium curvatum]|nr:hypothetical protein DFJ74DRAFT_94870 [Hyaloraphidium curvatum]
MVKLQLDDPKRPGSKLVPNPFNTAITVIQPNGTRFKYTFSYKYENGLIKSWDLIPSKSLNIEPHVHNGRLYTRQHKYSSDKSPEACVPKPQYLSTPESIKGNCPEEKQRQRRRAPGEIAPCDLSDERCQELFEERRAKFLKVSGKTQEEAEKIWDRLGMLPGAARYELERMCPSDHIRRAKGVPKNNKMREGWRKEAGVLKEACFWDAEKKDYVTRAASVEEWSSKLPTPRTSDPDLFQRHARCMLQTLPGLLAHYGRYRERQLRMTSKRRGDHTMAKMAEVYFAPDVLVRPYDPGGGGGGDVIVASDNTAWISFQSIAGTVLPYGDANFSTSIRGRPPTPNRQLVKSLRRLEEEGRDPRKNQHLAEWRKDLCLSFVREFRTSRMCRECHITVCKQAKGRECGLLQNNKTIWGVKYCELCHVMWSRDINAAFNILWIFLFTILNEGDRPEGFFVEV